MRRQSEHNSYVRANTWQLKDLLQLKRSSCRLKLRQRTSKWRFDLDSWTGTNFNGFSTRKEVTICNVCTSSGTNYKGITCGIENEGKWNQVCFVYKYPEGAMIPCWHKIAWYSGSLGLFQLFSTHTSNRGERQEMWYANAYMYIQYYIGGVVSFWSS